MIRKGLVQLVVKGFDIREGEMHRAFLMQANIFLIITTLLIVKSSASGLFLSHFGVESLPIAYVLVAVVAALVTTGYSRMLDRVALIRMVRTTTIVSIALFIIFGSLLHLAFWEGLILYLIYIWVAIFALLTTSQFWVLANLVFNSREAKRLFGFIGSGAVAGGIFGGYLTSVLAPLLSAETMLFIGALFLLPCIPINQRIWKNYVLIIQPEYQRLKRLVSPAGSPLTMIRSSRHLSYLACIVGVSVIVAKLVDYQFARIATSLIPDEDALTAFLGFWFSTFNVISLMLQLFLTRKVVGTLGVGTSLYFLPFLILFAAVTLFAFPELLMAAVILKMTDGSLKQSINKAAIELIILPVPAQVKARTKTFIDVFVDSAATGISGLLLIFIVRGLDLSTNVITSLIVIFVILWLYFARRIKQEYLTSLKLRIADAGAVNTPDKSFELGTSSAIAGLRNVLNNGTERQLLFVMGKIRELKSEAFWDDLVKLLRHPGADVRAEALHTLYYVKRKVPEQIILPLTKDNSQKVKIQAFEYLLEHSGENSVALMDQFLRDHDYKVRSAALISLAVETRNNPALKERFEVDKRIASRIEQLQAVDEPEEHLFRTKTILRALGHSSNEMHNNFIRSSLASDNPAVANEAIYAVGVSLQQTFMQDLIGFLGSDQHRESAKVALINFGLPVTTDIVKALHQGTLSPEIRRAIPEVLRKLNNQTSIDLLLHLVQDKDRGVRHAALQAMVRMHQEFPTLRFDKKKLSRQILTEARLYQDTLSALHAQLTMHSGTILLPSDEEIREARSSLIELLNRRLDQNISRIFQLLGLRYPDRDIPHVYEGIQSTEEERRQNALEFLDNVLEPGLKRVLVPLIETSIIETISEEAVRRLDLRIPSEQECFSMLLKRNDVRIKLAVLYLISKLGRTDYLLMVREVAEQDEGNVQAYALKVATMLA